MTASNIFLVFWWLAHHKEPGYYEHLLEMVQMDTEQEIFACGLPKSGIALAEEAIESYQDIKHSLVERNKQEFLTDVPLAQRKLGQLEIAKTRVAINDLEVFLNVARFI